MSEGRCYIDSCCFIDLAKARKNLPDAGDKDDLWKVGRLLDACNDGAVGVYVSTLTIAECTSAGGTIDDDVKDLFVKLLTSGQFTRLVQPDVWVAERAHALAWDHGIVLAGADLMHVACAWEVGCDEFLTTDKRKRSPLKFAAQIQAATGMRVIKARDTKVLPDKYLQLDIPGIALAALKPKKPTRTRKSRKRL
jgi:hypothetical protein